MSIILRIDNRPTRRREVLAGAAAVVATAALPVPLAAEVVPPAALWPMETQAQRQMVIIRVITEHIAETEGRAERSVTTDDVYDRVRIFGMTRDDVVAGREAIARRKHRRLPQNKHFGESVLSSPLMDAGDSEGEKGMTKRRNGESRATGSGQGFGDTFGDVSINDCVVACSRCRCYHPCNSWRAITSAPAVQRALHSRLAFAEAHDNRVALARRAADALADLFLVFDQNAAGGRLIGRGGRDRRCSSLSGGRAITEPPS